MSIFEELKRRNVFRVGIAYGVAAWLLIQISDTVFPRIGLTDSAVTLVIALLAIGFIPALIFAWAFEMTPEGIKREKDVVRSKSIVAHTGKKLDRAIIGILIIAVALLVFDRFREPEKGPENSSVELKEKASGVTQAQGNLTAASAEPDPADSSKSDAAPLREAVPSIAILPFENMSGDTANEPFTVGIHDDLLTQVSKIGSLRTISRTSVLQFPGSDRTIPEIARELGVSTVLEGGVQMAGDQVRINVQLIDAVTDEHIWAETYDRELSAANIFAIQSEIATSIANALEATLTVEDRTRLESAPTNNLEALEAYFTGKHLADQREIEAIEAAVRKYEQAVELDPGFALAYAGLAYAWFLVPEYSATADRALARQTAQAAMARALEIDPKLPEGLTLMGWRRMANDYDWQGAEESLRQALDIRAGHTGALHWLSHVLSWQGRHDEAIKIAEAALESDPLSPLMTTNMTYILMDVGNYERSSEFRDRTLQLQSDFAGLWRVAWMSALRAGEYGEATSALLSWAAGSGRDLAAAKELGRLMEHAKQSGQAVALPAGLLDTLDLGSQLLPQVYAAVGDAESALTALRVGLDERTGSRSVLSMKINPLYDFIRDEPRFIEMLREVNLAP